MAIRWIKTAHKGLRYYEHETRRHGKRKDRYYAIHFKVDKKVYDYGIGWWSDGVPDEARQKDPNIGFEEFCISELRQYRANVKAGSGVRSPREKRKAAAEKEALDRAEGERRIRESITFEKFFADTYLPQAKTDKKERSVAREEGLFKVWISPVLGHFPMKDIAPFHLEKLKRDMTAGGQSPRSVEYALSVVRQIFNTARRLKAFTGPNPAAEVKFPKPDNGRMRFLTPVEASLLLAALAKKSVDVHDMALLSLHVGLRFGEIASLTWKDVDLDRGVLTIRDAKAGSRYAFLTEQAVEMFRRRPRGNPSEYVFKAKKRRRDKKISDGTGEKPAAYREKLDRISITFARVVDELKLNEGIDDPRLQICFHSCRHSYASWLIDQGADLYTVQKLLGHKTNVMTQRYAHLAESKLRDAAMALSRALKTSVDRADETDDEARAVNVPA